MVTEPDDVLLADGVVLLRPIAASDAAQVCAACQDPRLQQFIPVPQPYVLADAEEYIARSVALWPTGRKAVFSIVEPTDHDRLLGVISLSIAGRCGNGAYWVNPEARGRGIARHALGLLTEWAFTVLDMAVVLLEIHETNTASAAVANAVGYHESGRIDVNTDTGPKSALLYVRLVTDPPHGPESSALPPVQVASDG
ncbi:MAG: GNAT family N-acetyltransferase [Aquihabitans sp.]